MMKYQYALNIQGSGTFELRKDMVASIEGKNTDMNGFYIIGVQSPQRVNFTIAVTNSDVSFGILHKGIPMNY